jgi:hypothetical protein
MQRSACALRYDPLPALNASPEPAIRYHVEALSSGRLKKERLWELKGAKRVIAGQLTDGSWKYPGGGKVANLNYSMLETYRRLGLMVEKYGMDRSHPALTKAAEYMLDLQTDEGDLRGIYASQYSPNYAGAILELLIKAGYERDRRVLKGLQWLLGARQTDGGWAIPFRSAGVSRYQSTFGLLEPIHPDLNKPSSHMVTGVVLRAFAAHPELRSDEGVRQAGWYLGSRFFMADRYQDRKAPSFWTSYSFPFWYTDLLSSLDSLSRLEIGPEVGRVGEALGWFAERQRDDGTWRLKYLREGDKDIDQWVNLALARVFARYDLLTLP